MNAFGKIVSSVSEAFEFNQATLSGCVDIIVVQQRDGSLKSTPFHVRFGKLKVLKSKDKVVKINVNGNEAGLTMKLGEAGEGFFEREVIQTVGSRKSYKRIQPSDLGDAMVLDNSYAPLQEQAPGQEAQAVKNAVTVKQQNRRLVELLDIKHTHSDQRTSAETKAFDDQDANAYNNFMEVESPLEINETRDDEENSIPSDEGRPKSQTMPSYASNFNVDIPCKLYQSAKLEKTNKNEKVKRIKVKTLRPSPAQLKALNLRMGANTISYTVQTGLQGFQTVSAHIYLWTVDTNIIISDIDGTITKSDFLGHILPMFGKDWSQPGIAPLYQNIRRNGYQILYLTARPIGQTKQTKDFLHSVYQDGTMLPHGPMITSPDRMFPSVKRELILRRPEIFKMAVLKDIRSLFPEDHNPFHAGFGNRETDAISYRSVGIHLEKVFIVNPQGHIYHHGNKRNGEAKSYALINTMIKEMFPGIAKDNTPDLPEGLNEDNIIRTDNQSMIEAGVAKVVS